MAKTVKQDATIVIPEICQEVRIFHVVGQSPLILHRMSEKARHELLLPAGRKTEADKRANLKHDPISEYQASPYVLVQPEAPTYLALMSSAFKGAMGTAALDLPGASKSQIGRLSFVEGDYTPVYGTPKLFMSIVRNSDINHTPDIRTRAILPRWAARVEVVYVVPLLNAQAIANLLAAAGTTVGVGDYRPEKGKGSYGRFRIVNADDPEYLAICQEDRAAQIAALETPEAYDAESAEMMAWFITERQRRGKAPESVEVNGRGREIPVP